MEERVISGCVEMCSGGKGVAGSLAVASCRGLEPLGTERLPVCGWGRHFTTANRSAYTSPKTITAGHERRAGRRTNRLRPEIIKPNASPRQFIKCGRFRWVFAKAAFHFKAPDTKL